MLCLARSGNSKLIDGYFENWKAPVSPGGGGNSNPSYYKKDVQSCNHVLYSFLCLDQHPNAGFPAKKYWDGKALYETMTAADVIEVMTETNPRWQNPNEWQRSKVSALIDSVHENKGKFIWAIGGWSDLTQTLREDQIPHFVELCVKLLKLDNGKMGDGIDFDWEHLSDDARIKDEQRMRLAKTMLALRAALDNAGMQDKTVGYTTRFNAFWDDKHGNIPAHYTSFESDGEGLKIAETMNELGASLNDVVDWVHIMEYDVRPSDLNCPDRMQLSAYVAVFDAFTNYVDKNKIVMGFEPGHQAGGGLWEGSMVDKQVIDYIQENNLGGVMFWAVNEHATLPETGMTGKNAQELAKYAKSKFH